MKANTTSVSTDLGGGANGSLGPMVTPVEYINASAIPYVRPIHPGVLNALPGTTHHESTRLWDEFKEELRQYSECIKMEKALIKKFGCALPQIYLRGFKNEYTNINTTDIPTILEHLFTTYGAIEPEE